MKRALILVALALAGVATARAPAHAQLSNEQKVRCANAYEQAQRTRNEGLYRASREHTLVCADELCPKVLRDECMRWLGEIDAAMPTILVVARDEKGNEVSDVTVSVDGTQLVTRLDGKALPVDPGTRTFRFVRPGSDAIEQKLLIREGEKRRSVAIAFSAASSTPSTADPSRTAADPAGGGARSVPAATWILGSVGVVALGVSVPMYLSFFKQQDALEACAPRCNPDQGDAAKRQLIYANVTSAIGVAAVGAAVLFWIAAPAETTRVSAGIAPTAGGMAAALRVTF